MYLSQVGHFHDLSAGLLIGGKSVADEAARVNRMNVLVATPGALLTAGITRLYTRLYNTIVKLDDKPEEACPPSGCGAHAQAGVQLAKENASSVRLRCNPSGVWGAHA
jgi:hypothetical protein